jgi:acyl-CoA reductase-like NAD-dependent aldehyde dehydrogenase
MKAGKGARGGGGRRARRHRNREGLPGQPPTYGLAAAVWTRDVSNALKAAKAIRAGTVWVNAYNLFDAALPFGGFKESGSGREMGSVGLDNYTEVETVRVDLP